MENFPWALSWESSCGPHVASYTEILNFREHFRGYLRVHSRVHFRVHFRERVRGSNFAVSCFVPFWDKLCSAVRSQPSILRCSTGLRMHYFARSPENICGFFLRACCKFCIEKWRGFLVNFSGLRFPGNDWQNSGRKFERFGELSFCNFSDLRMHVFRQRGSRALSKFLPGLHTPPLCSILGGSLLTFSSLN